MISWKINKGSVIIYAITGFLLLLLMIFSESNNYIKFSYVITFYLAAKLIQNIGSVVPFRGLILFIGAIQYLLAPALDYEFLGPYNPYFKMTIPIDQFYSFVMSAFVAMWIGLSLPLKKRSSDVQILNRLRKSPQMNGKIGVTLVCIGFSANYIAVFFTLPNSLNFIFTLLSMMRFVGLLYVWLSDHKYRKWFVYGVLGEYAILAFSQAIFIQLIILVIFLYSYYSLVHRPNKLKIAGIGVIGLVVLFLLQSVKAQYRQALWVKGVETSKVDLLQGLVTNRLSTLDERAFLYSAASANLRINQGWVIQLIMKNIPVKRPFLDGVVFYDELVGLLFPRFIFPDKAAVQTSEKFEKFVGYRLRGYTIAVGILGDGYGNFGVDGGILFCFCVGLFFNICLVFYYRLSEKLPAVYLWGIFIFFYVIRAGDDFYIMGNWVIKSSMLLAAILFLFRRYFISGLPNYGIRKRAISSQI